MNHAAIRVQRDGAITVVTLARAEPGNRLDNDMLAALASALDAAGDSRAVLLRAEGPDFCLGRDMQPPAPGVRPRALELYRDDPAPVLALYETVRRRRQPLVAEIAGRAWGIGCVLAALADLTLAAEDATFRLAELERGIPPCIAMAPLVPRMPAKALAHLVLSAEPIGAREALAAGLVGRVVPADALPAAVVALLQRLVSFAPETVAAVQQYLAVAARMDPVAAEQHGASVLVNVLASR